MNRNDISEHMMVHARSEGRLMGARGVHVGTVDKVDGDFIKLTKNDSPDHEHRWIPIGWVDHIDEKAVYLNRTADEFRQGAMTENPAEDSAPSLGRGSAAASGAIANGTGTGKDLLGDTRDTTSRSSMLSDPSRLPSGAGGTVSGIPSGMSSPDNEDRGLGGTGMSGTGMAGSGVSGMEALGSAGGSIMSDREIDRTGESSPMGDAGTTTGTTTDSYTAAGTGNTTADTAPMSGAEGASGMTGDHNTNTGAQGNVSGEDGLPGQGTRDAHDHSDRNFDATQGTASDDAQVQGMHGYDTSYSGGSEAMPGAGGRVGGSAATPNSTMNSNLDPSLAGTDFDQGAMGQAVDERQDDAQDGGGDPNRRG